MYFQLCIYHHFKFTATMLAKNLGTLAMIYAIDEL